MQTHDFTIYKGLTFAGFQLIALNSAGAAVAQEDGTTYLCQARTAPGKALSFELPVTRGTDATGQIIMEEVDAATTAEFPVGTFVYDLVPVDSESKAWEPILKGTITVAASVSLPA